MHGHLGMALLLGAVWGAGAGAAGALLAYASGAAGRQAAPLALGSAGPPVAAPAPDLPGGRTVRPGTPYRPANPDTNPYLRAADELQGTRRRSAVRAAAPARRHLRRRRSSGR